MCNDCILIPMSTLSFVLFSWLLTSSSVLNLRNLISQTWHCDRCLGGISADLSYDLQWHWGCLPLLEVPIYFHSRFITFTWSNTKSSEVKRIKYINIISCWAACFLLSSNNIESCLGKISTVDTCRKKYSQRSGSLQNVATFTPGAKFMVLQRTSFQPFFLIFFRVLTAFVWGNNCVCGRCLVCILQAF